MAALRLLSGINSGLQLTTSIMRSGSRPLCLRIVWQLLEKSTGCFIAGCTVWNNLRLPRIFAKIFAVMPMHSTWTQRLAIFLFGCKTPTGSLPTTSARSSMSLMNSIIQNIKRRARGFRNDDYFKTMIYLGCGKLNLKIDGI